MNINNVTTQHGLTQTQQEPAVKTNHNASLIKQFQEQLKDLKLPRTEKQAMLELFKENLKTIQGERPTQTQQPTTQTSTDTSNPTLLPQTVSMDGVLPEIATIPPVLENGVIPTAPEPPTVVVEGPTPYFL